MKGETNELVKCECGDMVMLLDFEECEECKRLLCIDHFTYCDSDEAICNDCYL